MTMDLLHQIGSWPWREITGVAAFLSWASFWGCFSILARWWKTPEGQNVWLVSLALTWAFGIITAAYLWPEYDIRPWFVPVTFGLLALLGVQRTYHLFRRRAEKRRQRGQA